MSEAVGLIIFVAMVTALFIGFGGIAKARNAWSKARFFVLRVAKERPMEAVILALLLIVCTVYGGTKPPMPPDEPDEPIEPDAPTQAVKVLVIGRRADGSFAPLGEVFVITNTLEEVEQ